MPVLGGFISTRHGWRAQFQIMSAFLGPALILVILLVPEHAYNRPAIFNTDLHFGGDLDELDEEIGKANRATIEGGMEVVEKLATSDGVGKGIAAQQGEIASGSGLKTGGVAVEAEVPITSSGEGTVVDLDEERKTWVQELRVYNGRFSDESFFKLIFAPFALLLYPATLWAFSLQGTFITWVCVFIYIGIRPSG